MPRSERYLRRHRNISQTAIAVKAPTTPTTIQKPCLSSLNGMPPTFIPNNPPITVNGKPSTVTSDNSSSNRLFCSLTRLVTSS